MFGTSCWIFVNVIHVACLIGRHKAVCCCSAYFCIFHLKEFDLQVFNRGDYEALLHRKQTAERLTSVLYPNDANEKGLNFFAL